jgi:hypothetical protein
MSTATQRADIIDRANTRGFNVEYLKGGWVKGQMYGYGLEHPSVRTDYGSFAISWALAERIANGETNRVLA